MNFFPQEKKRKHFNPHFNPQFSSILYLKIKKQPMLFFYCMNSQKNLQGAFIKTKLQEENKLLRISQFPLMSDLRCQEFKN